jgi:hypothetical protein
MLFILKILKAWLVIPHLLAHILVYLKDNKSILGYISANNVILKNSKNIIRPLVFDLP